MIAQIGVNISANVISVSNDMTSLFPKYINLRRAAIVATVVGGWIMVPWKIVTGAASLLNFMASLGIFLAPIIAISISDYWIIKKRIVDVPSLYRPDGRYRYRYGVNWRAGVAMLVALGPAMPSLAKNIDATVDIGGAKYIADLVWYYGMLSAFVTYVGLSLVFPARESLVSNMELEVFKGEEVGVEQLNEEASAKEKEAGITVD